MGGRDMGFLFFVEKEKEGKEERGGAKQGGRHCAPEARSTVAAHKDRAERPPALPQNGGLAVLF